MRNRITAWLGKSLRRVAGRRAPAVPSERELYQSIVDAIEAQTRVLTKTLNGTNDVIVDRVKQKAQARISAGWEFWYRLATSPPMQADAIVILAGEDAIPRYQAGLQLFAQGAAPFIVVSGGKADTERWIPASTLRERLIGAGVKPDRILVDNVSQNTREQAVNVIQMAVDRQWARLILVASPYHAPRAFLTFLAALNQQTLGDTIRLVSVAADHTSWDDKPAGVQITREQLMHLEAEKIRDYGEIGDCASYEDGLAYLEAWSKKP